MKLSLWTRDEHAVWLKEEIKDSYTFGWFGGSGYGLAAASFGHLPWWHGALLALAFFVGIVLAGTLWAIGISIIWIILRVHNEVKDEETEHRNVLDDFNRSTCLCIEAKNEHQVEGVPDLPSNQKAYHIKEVCPHHSFMLKNIKDPNHPLPPGVQTVI